MPDLSASTAPTRLITISQLAEFFGSSEVMAKQVMRRIGLPKRGKGYSRQRLWLAMGFLGACPADEDPIWRPLLDAPAVARAATSSAKTIGRMFDGSHTDKTFTNCLRLGPRKRVIFPFELEAWLTGVPPRFERPIERIHPSLRRDGWQRRRATKGLNPAHEVARPTAGLFLAPRHPG